MTGTDLPVELAREIVAALANPEYPLQFGHRNDVKRALLQLSLVNHAFRDIVRPVLYSTIAISSENELHAFLTTSSSARSFTASLWLRNFAGKFSKAIELIRILGPSLRRLALDIPELELNTPSVREALRACINLVEFARSGYSPMQLLHPRPAWADWTGLRRLALDGPLIDNKFINYIEALPQLSHVVLIEPRWRYSADGTETAIFMKLLFAGKGLQQIFLVYCQPDQRHLNSLKRLKAQITLRQLRRGPQVFYTVMEEPVKSMTFIRRQIGQGELWDFSAKNLLGCLSDNLALELLDNSCGAQSFTSSLLRRETSILHDMIKIH